MGKPKTEQNIQDLPPGYYWGKMDVRPCWRCDGRGGVYEAIGEESVCVLCARCNGLGYLYKVVEMEPMGRSNRDERITIEPPGTPTRPLFKLQEGDYFRCPKGEAVYQVIHRPGVGQHPSDIVRCRMVGRPGTEGEYTFERDKRVVLLHLTGIQFREADK